jgi:protein involved in temperature-dependent protein secretion
VSARTIPDPGFSGDRGKPDAALAAALAAYAGGIGSQVDALAAVRGSRLLVPVVAVLGEVETDDHGLAHDKTSDMATVLLQGADGRMALLAFSGIPALQSWDPQARPVPVTARTAAQAALQDGAAAIVVDVAGPASFVVEGQDLEGLARGWVLARVGGRSAWVAPDAGSGE